MLQLISATGQQTVDALAFLLAFALTALMDSVFHDKLPHDHGRAFAVNGELSKGKARGSGLIFVLCIALVTLAVVPFKVEYLIYTVLLIASMLSGYFDDASETAWNEYKKGLIDFVIAVVAGVTYLNFNGTSVNFLRTTFTIAYPLYLLLIVILIWASINVVRRRGTSLAVSIGNGEGERLLHRCHRLYRRTAPSLLAAGTTELQRNEQEGAYLWSNAKPSSLLMGRRRTAWSRVQPGWRGFLPRHPGPWSSKAFQPWATVRLPAGGAGVHRGRQPRHPEDQLQALPPHQHPQEHPHSAARPCAQAHGLERRTGGGPLAHPAGRRIGAAPADDPLIYGF